MWPLPTEYRFGTQTLTVDPNLTLETRGAGGNSLILLEAFKRYRELIFEQGRENSLMYDIGKLTVIVASGDDTVRMVMIVRVFAV